MNTIVFIINHYCEIILLYNGKIYFHTRGLGGTLVSEERHHVCCRMLFYIRWLQIFLFLWSMYVNVYTLHNELKKPISAKYW